MVMCDGAVIYQDGRFTRVDQGAVYAAIKDAMDHALSDDEMQRRDLSGKLLPFVKAFYRDYIK